MRQFLTRYALTAALLLGFAVGVAVAAGTNLGTVGHYYGTIQNKTAAYAPVCTTDSGTEIVVTVSSTVAVTLPNNGNIGCQVMVTQGGTAKVTIVAQTGGALISPHGFTGTFARGSPVVAHVIANAGGAAAQWVLGGDGS